MAGADDRYQEGYEIGLQVGIARGREAGWSEGFRASMNAEAAYTKEISDELDDMYDVCGDLLVAAVQQWKTGRCKTAEHFREQIRGLVANAEERIDFDELIPDDKYGATKSDNLF